MTDKLIHRHDQFLKRLLDQPGTAGALLKERLPAEVAALLTDDAPELLQGSFVSQELAEYRTDRLYRSKTKTGRAVLIYTVIEHKSSVDRRIGLQLLGYVSQILQNWAGNNPDSALLPPVLTLVVYNGSAVWDVPLSLAAATDADEILRPWLPDLRYNLVELRAIQDGLLSKQEALKIGFLILKRGTAGGDLYEDLIELGRAAAALGMDDLVALVRYLLGEPNNIRSEILRRALAVIVPGQEDRIMSIAAEEWKAEGKAEGKVEGQIRTLSRLIERRFGALSDALRARLESADLVTLDLWTDRVIDAKTLDEIFDDSKLH